MVDPFRIPARSRQRQASPAGDHRRTHAGRVQAVLAGSLKSENSVSNGLGKVDDGELAFIEQIVISALVDDSDEIVLGSAGVWQDSIDLAKD
jgi:hypothetical protein